LLIEVNNMNLIFIIKFKSNFYLSLLLDTINYPVGIIVNNIFIVHMNLIVKKKKK